MKILDWITRWCLKPISPPLCVILVIVSIPYAAGCSNNTQATAPLVDPKTLTAQARKVTGAEKLTNSLEDLEALCTGITKKLARNKTVRAELDEAKSIAQDLVRADSQIRAEFAKTRKVLARIRSREKNRIQAKVERDYGSKMRKTQVMVATLTKEKTRPGLATRSRQLSQFIDSVTPEPPHQPLGTELPHRIVDYHAGPPTLGTQIAPAYAPNTPGAEPSNLPRAPTAADTSETIEIQFTEDISATANDLSKDPVKMYEFVRNNMNFEPYYGSRKGAAETLLEKGGNDFDQASLLIALFRYSGIPARYVQGVVDVPIAKAMNWVGVEKPEVAAKMLSAGGVPSQAVISGGRITAIRLEHVWTEVYVNYENYRGKDAGPGKKQWIPLDPSFKQYEYRKPIDLSSELSFDATGLANHIVESATVDATTGAISNIDQDYIQATFAQVQQEASAYVSSHPGLEPEDYLGSRRTIQERLGLLPAVLSLKTVGTDAEWDKAPDSLRHKLTVSGPGFSDTRPLAELAGRRITLSYSILDENEKAIGASYSGMSQIPAYLVHAAPILRIDGARVATGTPLPLGTGHECQMVLHAPGEAERPIENLLTVGGYYAVGMDLGSVARATVERHHGLLTANADVLANYEQAPDALFYHDDFIGEQLNLPLLNYFAQLDVATRLSGTCLDVSAFRMTSLGMIGFSTRVDNLIGVPRSVVVDGFFTDIDNIDTLSAHRTGDTEIRKAFARVTGLIGSELEDAIWRQLYPDSSGTSVSASRVLRLAMARNVPLHVISSQNISQALPCLTVTPEVRSDIENAVAAGYVVTIPRSPITEGAWTGTGYIIEDPRTGSAGYMLADGTAGDKALDYLVSGLGITIDTVLGHAALVAYGVLDFLVKMGTISAVTAVALSHIVTILVAIPAVAFAIYSYDKCIGDIWSSKMSTASKIAYTATAATVLGTYLGATAYGLLSTPSPAAAALTQVAIAAGGLTVSLALSYLIPSVMIPITESMGG